MAKNLRRIVLSGLAVILLLGLLIQVVPYGRAHDNPPVIAEPQWDTPHTRDLFFQTCGDCHSNQTTWPWYSNIAPVSWLVQHDVEEGRSVLNVSQWGVGRNEGDDAAEVIQNGEMPPPIYIITHPSANLSATDKQALIKGLTASFGGEYESEGHETEHDDD